MGNALYTSILLVTINHEGCLKADFVDYSKYGGYDWLADVDINKLQLNRFPYILSYIQHYGYNLELKYLKDEMILIEIVSMQRDGGYKEPFQRVVKYSHHAYSCLKKLENDLFMQLHFEYQNNDSSVKKNVIRESSKKIKRCAKIKFGDLFSFLVSWNVRVALLLF